jgi:hypothetical protein
MGAAWRVAKNLQTVHGGQAQVREHQVGALGELQGGFGGARLLDFKARRSELQLEDAPELFFVLDDQDASLHAGYVFILAETAHPWTGKDACPTRWRPLARIAAQYRCPALGCPPL